MSNDNFLLTVLGAVGIGALMMGLNQEDSNETIQENYDGMTTFGFSTYREPVAVGKDGCMRAVNFAKPRPGSQELNQKVAKILSADQSESEKLNRLQQLGAQNTTKILQKVAKSASRTAQLSGNPALAERMQKVASPSSLAKMAPGAFDVKEPYEPDNKMGLGASMVTAPTYFSDPHFDQTVPQRSPSLNLGRDIRYNPPSTDLMGISSNYQNLPQNAFPSCGTQVEPMAPSSATDMFNMIETYEQPPVKRTQFMAGIDKYPGPNYMADKKSFVKEVAAGNAGVADNSPLVIAPLTCQEGCDDAAESLIPVGPDAQDDVVIYDRLYTVPLKPGQRQRQSGTVDFIRGDLPVCVDPCQAGWFQSAQKPAFLFAGAISNKSLADVGTGQFIQTNGGSFNTAPTSGQITANQAVNLATGNGSLVVSSANVLP